MADKTKPGDIKQEKRGSIFKTAVISAPIAIGGGIGISNLSKRSSHFSEPVESLPNATAVNAVRRFANRYVSPEHAGVFKEWQLDKLAGFSKNTALSPEIVKSSFMHAVQATDPSGMLLRAFNQRLAHARTAAEVYADISQILSTSNSVYARKATSLFLHDVSTLEARASAGLPVTTTAFMGRVPRKITPLALGELDPRVSADIMKIAGQLNMDVSVKRVRRRDVPGSELRLTFGKPRDPFFTLRVPETLADRPGLITHGATQQSRYIAGMYGTVVGDTLQESFSHEQWAVRRALEDLIPEIQASQHLTSREIRNMVSQFEQRMLEAPEWIPTLPSGMHRGVDIYARLRSQVMRLYTPQGEPLTEFEYAQIIERGGLTLPEGGRVSLFPSHSPAQIAKGVASTVDPRRYSLIPEAVDVGRRPFQRYRVGAAPTPSALEAIQSHWRTGAMQWAMDPVGVPTPMASTAYVSSALGHRLAGTGMTAEGQLLLSSSLSAQRAVRQWRQFDVASDRLVDLANLPGFSHTKAHWTFGSTLPKGSLLGYSPDGRPVVLPADMTIEQATAFTDDKAKGNFIRVMATQDTEQMRFSKVFGGAKGMAVTVDPDYIRQVLASNVGLGASHPMSRRAINAVVTMDELKKNRALHYNQMLTSLWDFTRLNMQSGKQVSTQAQNFFNNPHAVIEMMRKTALNADKFDHDAMLQQLMGLARSARLSPAQMGGVFGAVPEIYGGLDALGKLSAAEATEIGRGTAFGYTQFFFEGLGGPGSGKTATIEPRMYELLAAPHLGATGAAIQEEVAGRMVATYPHRLTEQGELTKALQSIMRPGSTMQAKRASQLVQEEALPTTGFHLRVGGGLGDIYVPGSSTLSQLAGYQSAGGAVIQPQLSQKYSELIQAASQYESRQITTEQMQGMLAGIRDELHRARIATITGKGGLLRGRLPGAVTLTAVQPTMAEKLPVGVVGITEPYIQQMFGDLEQLGLYDPAELKGMRSRLLAGERVSGVLGRHPYIGPYSSQVVQFQRVAGTEPIAMMHERMARAAVFAGKRSQESLDRIAVGAASAFEGDQKAIRKLEMQGAEMLGSPIRLSPFVGLAGDVDGDIVSAMLAGPRLEQSLTSYLSNQDALGAYEEYSIRSQVLKAKAAGDAVTLRKAMAGAGIKLGITETGRLGRLSASLQQYRAGVLSGMGGLSSQEAMDALGLLEWMEQTPISAKHIPQGKEEQLIHLLDDIQYALDKKNAAGIADAARTVLANAKVAGQQALRDGFDIAMEDVGGDVVARHIPGLNIDKAAANIVAATQAYETAGVGRTSAARVRAMMMRDVKPSVNDIEAMMKPWVVGQTPLSSFLDITGRPGKIAELTERAMSITNRMARAGRGMLPHARPLAVGTGVGLGLAMLLSEPPRVLSMESKIPPQPRMRATATGAHLDANIHPDSRVNIPAPPPSPTEAANTARITSHSAFAQQGYNVSVRARLPEGVAPDQLSEQIQQGVPGVGRVYTTVRDYRASLTPQRVSSILRDE